MDTAYYVMHPAIKVTAVVYAPATEKARTTFLDWLERNGLMRRADRQSLRKNMVAQKLDDPNVKSDIVLHYGYSEGVVGRGIGLGPDYGKFEEVEELPPGGPMIEGEYEEVPIELPKPEPKMMPIQKVMLRGLIE